MNDETLQRANLLMQHNRFDLAIEAYRQVLADSPEHAVAHASLGWCLTKCGRLDAGESHILQAVQLSPDKDYVHQIHGLHLIQRQHYAEAEAAIARALEIQPEYAPYYALLASTLSSQGKFAAAVAAAQQGISLSPSNVPCVIEKLLAQIDLNDFPAVEETIQLALRLAPESSVPHAAQGYVLLNQKEFASAADAFREALRLEPQMLWARNGLAQCLKERFPWYAKAAGFRLLTLSKHALRWYVMFAAIAIYGLVRYALAAPPKPAYFLELPLLIFFTTVFLTFSIEPLAVWLLAFDREGKHLLLPQQIRFASAVVGLLSLAILFWIAGFVAFLGQISYDAWPLYMMAFSVASPIPPLSKAFECEFGGASDSIWSVIGIAVVAGLICFSLAAWSLLGSFPLDANYYTCLGLVIVNMATLGASVLMPLTRFPQGKAK
ncbi:tetratricopeptide repeat protein [Blastopirellula sp. JC732]|uniref:Tetratricopeptide repeat protein n=1 Tax=Blastopirellula sediminis TaxID=2894196 RepID=A0A9X1MN49_9BACT|nr:tetratricopeptide repeat protein [Blastopirellula sediminis]MCC9607096.1 tetratricopeptide repeat protein [Blastopirellula sediminis]MCC9629611.1 tetratricopeptide repeat protein [Blastopirellula sediminis]